MGGTGRWRGAIAGGAAGLALLAQRPALDLGAVPVNEGPLVAIAERSAFSGVAPDLESP